MNSRPSLYICDTCVRDALFSNVLAPFWISPCLNPLKVCRGALAVGTLHVKDWKLIGQSQQATQFLLGPTPLLPAPLLSWFLFLWLQSFVVLAWLCFLPPLCSGPHVNAPQNSGPVSFCTLTYQLTLWSSDRGLWVLIWLVSRLLGSQPLQPAIIFSQIFGSRGKSFKQRINDR